MVGKDVPGHIEPEFRHLGQDGPLLGHIIFQDHIKTADTVCGNHDQAVAVVVNFPYFSFFYRFHVLHLTVLLFSPTCLRL